MLSREFKTSVPVVGFDSVRAHITPPCASENCGSRARLKEVATDMSILIGVEVVVVIGIVMMAAVIFTRGM